MRLLILALAIIGASFATEASAQTVLPGPFTGGESALYATGAIVGNGADTTLDTLQTYTAPASTLVNVGDAIHIVASGTFASSTDTKNIKVELNPAGAGPTIGSLVGNVASTVAWAMDIWIVKTGASTQSIHVQGTVIGSANGAGTASATTTFTDTNALTIAVQGQNATAATANTANCRIFMVSRRAAPGAV